MNARQKAANREAGKFRLERPEADGISNREASDIWQRRLFASERARFEDDYDFFIEINAELQILLEEAAYARA